MFNSSSSSELGAAHSPPQGRKQVLFVFRSRKIITSSDVLLSPTRALRVRRGAPRLRGWAGYLAKSKEKTHTRMKHHGKPHHTAVSTRYWLPPREICAFPHREWWSYKARPRYAGYQSCQLFNGAPSTHHYTSLFCIIVRCTRTELTGIFLRRRKQRRRAPRTEEIEPATNGAGVTST